MLPAPATLDNFFRPRNGDRIKPWIHIVNYESKIPALPDNSCKLAGVVDDWWYSCLAISRLWIGFGVANGIGIFSICVGLGVDVFCCDDLVARSRRLRFECELIGVAISDADFAWVLGNSMVD